MKELMSNVLRLGCFAYSHEENTHAYSMVDDVSPKIKQERINSVMEIQSQISLELNQKKINFKHFAILNAYLRLAVSYARRYKSHGQVKNQFYHYYLADNLALKSF